MVGECSSLCLKTYQRFLGREQDSVPSYEGDLQELDSCGHLEVGH